MKQTVTLLFLSVFFLMGCNPLTDDASDDFLTLKSENQINVEAGQSTVQIFFEATQAWDADSDSEWVVPDRKHGDSGDIVLDVTVMDNESGEARQGRIFLTCGDSTEEILLVQSANDDNVSDPESVFLIETIKLVDQDGYIMSFTYDYDYIDSFGTYMPVQETLRVDDYNQIVKYQYGSGYIDRIVLEDSGQEQYRYRLILDSFNRVTGVEDQENPVDYIVSYDSDGCMISDEVPESGYFVNFTWKDGNLVKSLRQDVYKGDINSDGIEENETVKTESLYYYTEYENNTNLDINDRLCSSYNSSILSDGPALIGIAGKRSRNIGYESFYEISDPSTDISIEKVKDGQKDQVTNTVSEIDNDNIKSVIDFNEQGYPVKITLTAPVIKKDVTRIYTYDINYDGPKVTIDNTVYYYDFKRNILSETESEPQDGGTVTRTCEISYVIK